LRGPSFDGAWVDELAAFKYAEDAWNNLLFGMRLGPNPQVVVSTTPRPIPIIKRLLKDPTCVVTRGSSNDNIVNLPEAYIEQVIQRYEGTRLGRQEIYAEILDDTPGALWTHDLLERTRTKEQPELIRIVVGVDPAASSGEGAAETGIIVAGALPAQRRRTVSMRSCGRSPRWSGTRFQCHLRTSPILSSSPGHPLGRAHSMG
jgi:phage terminase large subunit-like protein